jgi:hypothetical protein
VILTYQPQPAHQPQPRFSAVSDKKPTQGATSFAAEVGPDSGNTSDTQSGGQAVARISAFHLVIPQ